MHFCMVNAANEPSKQKSMCSSISWEQFILTIVVLVILYYLYIGVSYYRKDWLYRLSGKKPPNASPRPVASPATKTTVSPEPNPLLPLVHDLVDEIRAFLSAAGKIEDKESFLTKLRQLIQKYPTLKDSPFQPSINQLIAIDTKSQCSVELNEDEIDGLWG
jgi:hypothetical protein